MKKEKDSYKTQEAESHMVTIEEAFDKVTKAFDRQAHNMMRMQIALGGLYVVSFLFAILIYVDVI